MMQVIRQNYHRRWPSCTGHVLEMMQVIRQNYHRLWPSCTGHVLEMMQVIQFHPLMYH